jgi:hypothetical protein
MRIFNSLLIFFIVLVVMLQIQPPLPPSSCNETRIVLTNGTEPLHAAQFVSVSKNRLYYFQYIGSNLTFVAPDWNVTFTNVSGVRNLHNVVANDTVVYLVCPFNSPIDGDVIVYKYSQNGVLLSTTNYSTGSDYVGLPYIDNNLFVFYTYTNTYFSNGTVTNNTFSYYQRIFNFVSDAYNTVGIIGKWTKSISDEYNYMATDGTNLYTVSQNGTGGGTPISFTKYDNDGNLIFSKVFGTFPLWVGVGFSIPITYYNGHVYFVFSTCLTCSVAMARFSVIDGSYTIRSKSGLEQFNDFCVAIDDVNNSLYFGATNQPLPTPIYEINKFCDI